MTPGKVRYHMQQDDKPHVPGNSYGQLMTNIQSTLYAFIYSLLGGGEHVSDVLQETNFALWEKAAEYDSARDFAPWAYKFAYFQILAFRKRQQRDRLVFDDSLVESFSAEFSDRAGDVDVRLTALDKCVGQLRERHRTLLRLRYDKGQALAVIAKGMDRKVDAISMALYRIRKALAECVERTLHEGGSS